MHGQMEGSLAKTVRIGEMFSERIETSFPLLLLEKSGPDARCMDWVFIRHAACLLGCLLLCILAHGSSENPPRSSERNKGFEKNLRDGEKGLKREEISKTWSETWCTLGLFQQLPLNYPADIFPSQDCLTSWIANKKTCCQRGNYFSPAYQRVSKLVVRKLSWWRDEVERERRWKKWGRMTGVGGLAE